jgi:hypothetical protein
MNEKWNKFKKKCEKIFIKIQIKRKVSKLKLKIN